MNPTTNPFVVVLSRLGVPYQEYYCSSRALAERFAGVLSRGREPGETVSVQENV